MRKVVGVHNRPIENNCFDDFVAWCRKRSLPIRYIRWSDFAGCNEGEIAVNMMQDPVGRKKASVLPVKALNHPSNANKSVRDVAYQIWNEHGINCPPVPVKATAKLEDWPEFPFLIKETGKQMGRAFYVHDDDRLDWVLYEAKTFKEDRFSVIPFIDTRYSDGWFRLHRYLVCGNEVIPIVFAKTRNWCCKASHQHGKKWADEEIELFLQEWNEFYTSKPVNPSIKQCVKSLGMDFAMVDSTIQEDGTQIFWEVNPYVNMRPAEAAGKPERWFPFFANYLFGEQVAEEEELPLSEVRRVLTEFSGYKPHWTKT